MKTAIIHDQFQSLPHRTGIVGEIFTVNSPRIINHAGKRPNQFPRLGSTINRANINTKNSRNI